MNQEGMDALSDPFSAPCPKRGKTGNYRKADLVTLVAHQKH